jgi:hypothetical protein
MKLGDKKQAIGLGVVAVFAVGMLGKTALGTLSKANVDQPLVVKDVGGQSAKTDNTVTESGTPNQASATSNSASQIEQVSATTVKRDAFEKPEMPLKTKSFGQAPSTSAANGESYTRTGPIPPATVDNPQQEPLTGSLQGAENADAKATETKPSPKKAPTPELVGSKFRFDGYVNSGSPMGIVSVDGNSFSVSDGDSIGMGYRVESISSQKIKIRKGKLVKIISIGKETKI